MDAVPLVVSLEALGLGGVIFFEDEEPPLPLLPDCEPPFGGDLDDEPFFDGLELPDMIPVGD